MTIEQPPRGPEEPQDQKIKKRIAKDSLLYYEQVLENMRALSERIVTCPTKMANRSVADDLLDESGIPHRIDAFMSARPKATYYSEELDRTVTEPSMFIHTYNEESPVDPKLVALQPAELLESGFLCTIRMDDMAQSFFIHSKDVFFAKTIHERIVKKLEKTDETPYDEVHYFLEDYDKQRQMGVSLPFIRWLGDAKGGGD